MDNRLTPSTLAFLIIPPLMWAGNAVVGRIVSEQIPPFTLNFLRWVLASIILIPLGRAIFVRGGDLQRHWRQYAVLGFLGIGVYNGIQYLALHTSTPVNVTLVACSMPICALIMGALFFRTPISRRQLAGALLSIGGVLLVLSHGDVRQLLGFQFVIGDLYMLIATLIWTVYSWLLVKWSHLSRSAGWAPFLMAQLVYGTVWSGVLSGIELGAGSGQIMWSGTLLVAWVYVAIGPSLLALRCWSAGVQRVGPAAGGICYNLTPLFAAVLSLVLLGEKPQLFHAAAFVLIVGGIVLSSRRST